MTAYDVYGRAGRSLSRIACGPKLVPKVHGCQMESAAWSMARLSNLSRLGWNLDRPCETLFERCERIFRSFECR
ncbi:MAG: hypothetical protein QOD10_3299 [Mycobacterium sp.]|jgi:hypothetical protein|nr:hypothetical protein [Mycobacterium sp.]